jgi:DNA polymerase-3 subunit beta
MKLIILKNNLKEGLNSVEKGINENTNLPILKNILLKTVGNKIQLSATNLELGITKLISGKITEEGGLTVPFQTFYGLVNNINSDRISLETNNNAIFIKTDNYEAKIQCLNEDDYPIIPKIENKDYYLEFNTDIFKQALGQVINSAQISEIRPEISGILFDFQLTILKLVATDSFRLAEKNILNNQYKTNFEKGFKVIIPLKTAQEILRVFSNDQILKIYLDENQILFKNNDIELISRLIDGNYPDYEQIIPKEFESELVLEKEHFVNALKLVSNFSGKINDVKLKFQDNQRVLEVYSSNQYLGENSYLIPSKLTGGVFSDISFNWRYLLDGLKAVGVNNIVLGLNSNQRPAIIKSATDNSFFYILMPIKA